MMKQYQLAMPQQVFSGETGMQALESLAARHKKAAAVGSFIVGQSVA